MALLFTIITATCNAAPVLPRLLDSLAGQTCRDFELIIQDGASTDETVAIAESYRDRLPALSMESVPDDGIYDAWNRAVARARGAWLLFLGADDRLHGPEALAKAAEQLAAAPETADFFAASLLVTLPDGSAIETWRPEQNAHAKLPSGMFLPHPALFYRARLFAGNRFSTSLKIAGDYDFLCRALREDNYLTSTLVVAEMSVGGVSGSLPSMLDSELECLKISRKRFPRSFPVKLYARIARSAGYRVVAAVCGERAGRRFADFARSMQGKAPLWTREPVRPALPPLPEKPLVSLVIATLGRKEELKRLLDSLAAQTYTHFEVVIVDQNPSDFLHFVQEEYGTAFPVTRIPTPVRNASAARNNGLSRIRGDIVAFPDDDCRYAHNTLERIACVLTVNPYLGGILASWSDTERQPSGTPHTASSTGSVGLVNKLDAFRRAGTLVQFYRRQALVDVAFDPQLGPGKDAAYGSGEDTDFLLQVLRKGFSIGRISEELVYHAEPDLENPHLVSKVSFYARGRMYLLRKHHFPLWFKLANIVYPLVRLPLEGPKAWPYRKAMFLGRLHAFFRCRKGGN